MMKNNYQCIRCGYTTYHKSHMRKHFYKNLKPCNPELNDVELTSKIKEHILNYRVYRPQEKQKPTQDFIYQDTQSEIQSEIQTKIDSGKPEEKLSKSKTIPKKIRELVWNTYIGQKNGIGECWCCKVTNISQMNFDCGHVIAKSMGGKITVDNLRPICSHCNTSMSNNNMELFMKEHGFTVDQTTCNDSTKEIRKSKITKYECPRCDWTTRNRYDMGRHFNRKRICKNINNLELTSDIKKTVMRDFIYHPPNDGNVPIFQPIVLALN